MTATIVYEFLVASRLRRAEIVRIAKDLLGPGARVSVTKLNFGYDPLLRITAHSPYFRLQKEPFVRDMQAEGIPLEDAPRSRA